MMRDDEEPEATEFPALLKRLRSEAGISQQALAGRALVSVQAISALERGYRKAPYRETLDRLADALSLDSETRALFEAAAARARGARAQDAVPPPHNLPRRLTSFLGRDEVVEEIAHLISGAPLITIMGTGGAGKTRAAVEVGMHVLDGFADGVWFVELAALTDGSRVTAAVAAALQLQESSQRPLIDVLLSYLERKHMLLVLDNCEHVMNEARRVTGSILAASPKVNVLATSREALNVAGERIYKIPPLTTPESPDISAADALTYGAVALFADRALAADGRFTVTDDNVGSVVTICRRLDGLPLAIELAAARIPVLAPRQLASRLDRVFSVLNAGSYSVLPRHQTMRAVIDWSYGLLSSQARLLFRRLAIFPGGFGLEAAAEICAGGTIESEDVLDTLSSLVARSLLMVGFAYGDARYHLLESTRQYALERLEESAELAEYERRHVAYYLSLAQRLDSDWYRASERTWFDEAEVELDNCRAALDRALTRGGDVVAGQRLAAALARVWYSLSPVEGQRWLERALDAVDDTTPDETVARLNVADAELHGALGRYKASLSAAERALEVLERLDDPLLLARAKQAAGGALGALGRGEEGEERLREALVTARQLNNTRLRALVLSDLGTARSRRGDATSVRAFFAEALALYTSQGFERPAASIAGRLAEVEFAAGDAAAALRRVSEARAGHEATRNRRSVTIDLSNMAAYLVALGYYDDARTRSLEALAGAREMKASVIVAFILQHLAATIALEPAKNAADGRHKLERAARLYGFVDARIAALGARREYTEEQEHSRIVSALSEEFGEAELDELIGQGADWTEDRAVTEAMSDIA